MPDPTAMRFEGTLTTWNDDRGFGFLQSAQGGEEVFVHVKAFELRGGRPQVGQAFSFEIESGPQGRKRARTVRPLRVARSAQRRPVEAPAPWGLATILAIPAFLLVYVAVSLFWRPPLLVAAGYAVLSLVTFFAYAFDKAAAVRKTWRTPEKTLHTLALAGGWPGALLAQQLLRHKSAKTSFRAVFWATALLNVAAFVFLSSPHGRVLW